MRQQEGKGSTQDQLPKLGSDRRLADCFGTTRHQGTEEQQLTGWHSAGLEAQTMGAQMPVSRSHARVNSPSAGPTPRCHAHRARRSLSATAHCAAHCVWMLRDMSSAVTLWVSAPHEMKRTPVSAITLQSRGKGSQHTHIINQHGSERGSAGTCLALRHTPPMRPPDCVQRDIPRGLCLHLPIPNQFHCFPQRAHIQPRCR